MGFGITQIPNLETINFSVEKLKKTSENKTFEEQFLNNQLEQIFVFQAVDYDPK